MSLPTFFDVVTLAETEHLRSLGVSGARGIVLGIAEEGGLTWYAVSVGGETYHVSSADVIATSERVDPGDIYDGTTIHVDSFGNVNSESDP